jgi:hypothetical protein
LHFLYAKAYIVYFVYFAIHDAQNRELLDPAVSEEIQHHRGYLGLYSTLLIEIWKLQHPIAKTWCSSSSQESQTALLVNTEWNLNPMDNIWFCMVLFLISIDK